MGGEWVLESIGLLVEVAIEVDFEAGNASVGDRDRRQGLKCDFDVLFDLSRGVILEENFL